MIGAIINVNLHPIRTDLEEKKEDKMNSIFTCAGSHIVYFAMFQMQVCKVICCSITYLNHSHGDSPFSAHKLDYATTHRWCFTSHLTFTCDKLRTIAERVAELMCLLSKIFERYVPANITDGLWIRCTLTL